MLGVSEELAGPPAGEVAPSFGNAGADGLDAPTLPGRAHGGAVSPGQESQPPVGEGQPVAFDGDSLDQPGPGQRGHDLVEAGARDAQQLAQVLRGDSRPVVEQVEDALLGGLQQGWQQPVGRPPPRTSQGDVLREARPYRLRLPGDRSAPLHVGGQDIAKVEGGGDGGQSPDGSEGPAKAASRSRARTAGTCESASALRACLSRTSSGMSMSTAPGSGPSRSRHSRFENPVLSDVSPCLTTPTIRPPGSVMTHRGARPCTSAAPGDRTLRQWTMRGGR